MSEDNILFGKPIVVACDYRGLNTKNEVIKHLTGLGYRDIFQETGIKEKLTERINNEIIAAKGRNETGYEQFSKYVLKEDGKNLSREVMLRRIVEYANSDVSIDKLVGDKVLYDLGAYLPQEVDEMDAIDAAELAIRFAGDFTSILSCMTGEMMTNTAAKKSPYIVTLADTYEKAQLGRQHNDSRTLVIPGEIKHIPGESEIGGKVTIEIVDTFLNTAYDPVKQGKRKRRLDKWGKLTRVITL